MIQIREEIKEVEEGKADKVDNVLKNAPHTQEAVISSNWNHSYTREKAAFPLPYIAKRGKFSISLKELGFELSGLLM